MTTKLSIVQQALGEIGLGTYVFDPSPEQLQAALERLERLAAQWDGVGIRKGYSLGNDIAAESGLPDTAIDAYALHLALRLAPSYGKQISPTLMVAAKDAKNALMVTGATLPQVQYPGTMPVGVGNRRGVLDRPFYSPENPLQTGNDGEFTY